MDTNKIKILQEFNEFAYYKPVSEFMGIGRTCTEINIFGYQVAICISSHIIKEHIWFGIVGDIFNTRKIKIQDIKEYLPLTLIHAIDKIKDIYFQYCFNRVYMLATDSYRSKEAQSMAEDMYGNDILYIYGIWMIELPEQLQREIYPEILKVQKS